MNCEKGLHNTKNMVDIIVFLCHNVTKLLRSAMVELRTIINRKITILKFLKEKNKTIISKKEKLILTCRQVCDSI